MQQKLQRAIVKNGCQKLTWIMLTDTQNRRSLETLCTVHYRFENGFYGLSDILTVFVFQEHIDKALESKFKTPVWLDDIICVTNGTAGDRERELRGTLSKL